MYVLAAAKGIAAQLGGKASRVGGKASRVGGKASRVGGKASRLSTARYLALIAALALFTELPLLYA